MQVRVSDNYYSCDDSAPAAEKVLESDEFHITQEQSLQNDDTGNIACMENSTGTVSVKLLKHLCVSFIYSLRNLSCAYALITFECGSWKLTIAIFVFDVGFNWYHK